MNDKERILLVESDPQICEQIADNTLIPLGYQVRVIHEPNIAISEIRDFTPDVVLVNINLPGLSGKDLMVAITSQGIDTNFIVIAQKGQESEILHAVRMGAEDYLFWPAGDAEVVSVIENSLQRSRQVRESNQLNSKLQETRRIDQKRIQQLKMLLAISKEFISIRSQHELMNRLVEGVVHLSGADMGWIYLLNEISGNYRLAASCNLPELWVNRLGTTMEDGISSMVAMSGESLVLHGVSLKRFKVANLGQTAAAFPIKKNKKVVGLFVIVREKNLPFKQSEMAMMESVAELASLTLERLSQQQSIQTRVENKG